MNLGPLPLGTLAFNVAFGCALILLGMVPGLLDRLEDRLDGLRISISFLFASFVSPMPWAMRKRFVKREHPRPALAAIGLVVILASILVNLGLSSR